MHIENLTNSQPYLYVYTGKKLNVGMYWFSPITFTFTPPTHYRTHYRGCLPLERKMHTGPGDASVRRAPHIKEFWASSIICCWWPRLPCMVRGYHICIAANCLLNLWDWMHSKRSCRIYIGTCFSEGILDSERVVSTFTCMEYHYLIGYSYIPVCQYFANRVL